MRTPSKHHTAQLNLTAECRRRLHDAHTAREWPKGVPTDFDQVCADVMRESIRINGKTFERHLTAEEPEMGLAALLEATSQRLTQPQWIGERAALAGLTVDDLVKQLLHGASRTVNGCMMLQFVLNALDELHAYGPANPAPVSVWNAEGPAAPIEIFAGRLRDGGVATAESGVWGGVVTTQTQILCDAAARGRGGTGKVCFLRCTLRVCRIFSLGRDGHIREDVDLEMDYEDVGAPLMMDRKATPTKSAPATAKRTYVRQLLTALGKRAVRTPGRGAGVGGRRWRGGGRTPTAVAAAAAAAGGGGGGGARSGGRGERSLTTPPLSAKRPVGLARRILKSGKKGMRKARKKMRKASKSARKAGKILVGRHSSFPAPLLTFAPDALPRSSSAPATGGQLMSPLVLPPARRELAPLTPAQMLGGASPRDYSPRKRTVHKKKQQNRSRLAPPRVATPRSEDQRQARRRSLSAGANGSPVRTPQRRGQGPLPTALGTPVTPASVRRAAKASALRRQKTWMGDSPLRTSSRLGSRAGSPAASPRLLPRHASAALFGAYALERST